tara:strand:+ start:474 stop:776 length:303 start_codon:yes stop_codon:yes gene_type:complete
MNNVDGYRVTIEDLEGNKTVRLWRTCAEVDEDGFAMRLSDISESLQIATCGHCNDLGTGGIVLAFATLRALEDSGRGEHGESLRAYLMDWFKTNYPGWLK